MERSIAAVKTAFELEGEKLCWYVHVERSIAAVKTAFELQGDGKCGPGRLKMTLKQLTEKD